MTWAQAECGRSAQLWELSSSAARGSCRAVVCSDTKLTVENDSACQRTVVRSPLGERGSGGGAHDRCARAHDTIVRVDDLVRTTRSGVDHLAGTQVQRLAAMTVAVSAAPRRRGRAGPRTGTSPWRRGSRAALGVEVLLALVVRQGAGEPSLGHVDQIFEDERLLAGTGVPDPDRAVLAGGGEAGAVRAERGADDAPAVPGERPEVLPG